MELLNKTKDTIIIVTTIISALSVYIKIFNGTFINLLKNKYKILSDEINYLNMVVEFIIFISLSTSYFICIGFFIQVITVFDINVIHNNIIIMISSIVLFLGFIMIFIIGYALTPVEDFIENRDTSYEKIDKCINIYQHVQIISIIMIIGGIILFFYVISNNRIFDKITSITIVSLMIIGTGVYSIVSGILSTFYTINLKKINYLIINSETIICRFFLEYKDYYFVMKDNKRRYIRKSEVKEIIQEDSFEGIKQQKEHKKRIYNMRRRNLKNEKNNLS